MSADLRAAAVLSAVALVTPTLQACGAPAWPAEAAVEVDTLSDGAVELRNPVVGLWGGTPAWSLVEDLRLGSVGGDSSEAFGRIADVEVDDEGRIYVLDGGGAEVRIFAPDGAHLGTFGGRGKGPGELQRPRALARGPGGRVWVVDAGNQRYSVIDATGSLLEERRRVAGGNVYPWPGAVLDDGRIVDVDSRAGARIYTIRTSAGALPDTVELPAFEPATFVHTTEAARVSAAVPFTPRLHHVFDRRGFLWTGISEDYRIVQRTLDGGDSLRVVRREYRPVPVTGPEMEAALESLRWFREQGGRVDRGRIPGRHPAFRDFHVDRRGRLWVEPSTPGRGGADREEPGPRPSVFDVFDEEGRYLGRLEAGVALGAVRITGSHVYGVTADDLGVQYVVRLRIEGGGDG